MTTAVARPVSAKQRAFIERLLGERVADAEFRLRVESDDLTSREASDAIETLLAAPRVGNPEGVTEEGIYESSGVIYKVQRSKESGNLYAKRLVEIGGQRVTDAGTFLNAEYEYVPGVLFKLRATDKLSVERAEELTLRYGMCIRCSRYLKDAKSVLRGMGPVCASKF